MDDVEKQKHAAVIEPWTIKLYKKKVKSFRMEMPLGNYYNRSSMPN